MSKHIFDNRSEERRVATWLKQYLAQEAPFSVASAYFTVNAFGLLRELSCALWHGCFVMDMVTTPPAKAEGFLGNP